MGDDTASVGPDGQDTSGNRGVAILVVASSFGAVVYGWHLADLFGQCGTGDGSESYGWVKLLVATAVLAPGVVAAFASRPGSLARSLAWVPCVCAFPLLAALVAWLDGWSGCSS